MQIRNEIQFLSLIFKKVPVTIQNHGIDSVTEKFYKRGKMHFFKIRHMKFNFFFFQAQNSCFTIQNCGIDSNTEK